MQVQKEVKKDCYGLRIAATEEGREIGRIWLYIIYNDLHKEPYGLLEDIFVSESERGKGIGTTLVKEAIAEANRIGCYKLVATTRSSRGVVCSWYESLGFKNYGAEFRMDLI